MSISIYYSAKRKTPLSPAEIAEATEIIGRFSVDQSILDYLASGEGLNWESLDVQVNRMADVFSGSTKLPDNTEDATWVGVQHWCQCLSHLRSALPDCEWRVAVEDHEIHWDAALSVYDPSR
ncbi:hypothetical protein PS3A_56440 [Pseudomonas sp. 3A(2025)]